MGGILADPLLNTINVIKSIISENDQENLTTINQNKLRSRTTEFYYVAQRIFRNAIRNPAVAASQTIICTILAILTGLLFNNMKTTTHSSISDHLGAIFFISTHQTFCTGGALEALIKERLLSSHAEYIIMKYI
ncbi:unnamed protein product, partial [Rotaria sp. Silwood1]